MGLVGLVRYYPCATERHAKSVATAPSLVCVEIKIKQKYRGKLFE